MKRPSSPAPSGSDPPLRVRLRRRQDADRRRGDLSHNLRRERPDAATSSVAQTNDFLVARDDKGALQPALATSWEVIDPVTMRFHLRPGVAFTDGVAFTADDVVFTLGRVFDPKSLYGRDGAHQPGGKRDRCQRLNGRHQEVDPSTCCSACPTS